MAFADLSIAEIATDYSVPVEKVLSMCDELLIAYKNPKTPLARLGCKGNYFPNFV